MYPRSKVTGPVVQTGPWVHESSTDLGVTWSPVVSGDQVLHTSQSHFNGFGIERFHSRRRKGELLPFTSFSQFEHDTTIGVGVYGPRIGTSTQYRTLANWNPSSANHTYITKSELETVANQYDTGPMVQAAAAKIYASGHDSLTFLAELHKTTALFKGMVGRLKKLGVATRSHKYRGKINVEELKTMGKSWLEYRYAWRTLWFDIVDFHGAIKSLNDERKRFSQRVGYSDTQVNTTNVTFYEDAVQKFAGTITDEYSISVRGSVVADVEPPKFQFNPVLTGWELIRFSFIIDWFIGVGTWLESLSFLAVQSQYVAAGGIKVSLQRTVNHQLSWKAPCSGTLHCSNGESLATYTVRTPQSLPSRPFANVKLDVPKVLDLVAIFGGMLANADFSKSLRL